MRKARYVLFITINSSSFIDEPSGGVLIYVEGNFEIMNEERVPQEIAFGEGAPWQSWVARMCFGQFSEGIRNQSKLIVKQRHIIP